MRAAGDGHPGKPASVSACSAASATGSIEPSRVSVSSMSVITPTMRARACAGQPARGRAGRSSVGEGMTARILRHDCAPFLRSRRAIPRVR
jgi:hypothetical protein